MEIELTAEEREEIANWCYAAWSESQTEPETAIPILTKLGIDPQRVCEEFHL